MWKIEDFAKFWMRFYYFENSCSYSHPFYPWIIHNDLLHIYGDIFVDFWRKKTFWSLYLSYWVITIDLPNNSKHPKISVALSHGYFDPSRLKYNYPLQRYDQKSHLPNISKRGVLIDACLLCLTIFWELLIWKVILLGKILITSDSAMGIIWKRETQIFAYL